MDTTTTLLLIQAAATAWIVFGDGAERLEHSVFRELVLWSGVSQHGSAGAIRVFAVGSLVASALAYAFMA